MTQEPDDSPRHHCFGCGELNTEGLGIEFEVDGRRVTGRFTPRYSHQGFPGVAHGGIGAAALDEALGWAMYAVGAWAMTARMEVRYRKPVPLDEELIVSAEVTRERGRVLEGFAELRSTSGDRLSEAKAMFVRLPEERARELQRFFRGESDGKVD
jgi:acyl-coenzyme A thioesterase PaaI-like protein